MNANPEKTSMRKPDGLKRFYARPQVVVYGTIQEITQMATGNKGAFDSDARASKTQ
jgi:hypothetical protein